MVNITRGGGENRGVGDSQDRLVVVHAGVKQGLDHSEGKFGVLGMGGSILGLSFVIITRLILGTGTAEQSTMQNSQQQTPNERRARMRGNLRCFIFFADFIWRVIFVASSRHGGIQLKSRKMMED